MVDDDNKVSLKEYLITKIDDLEEKFDIAEKNRDNNLALQAKETERRLNALNGEAGRITKVLELSIPREVHERDINEIKSLHDRDIKEVKALIDVLNLAGQKWVTQDYLAGVLKEPNTDIRSLNSSRDVQTGKSLQNAVMIALIFSVISAIGTVIAIIINVTK